MRRDTKQNWQIKMKSVHCTLLTTLLFNLKLSIKKESGEGWEGDPRERGHTPMTNSC